MTPSEYQFLKNWDLIPLKRQHASPMPMNKLIEGLVNDGSLLEISRIDSMTPDNRLIVGYEVTEAGKTAMRIFELASESPRPKSSE